MRIPFRAEKQGKTTKVPGKADCTRGKGKGVVNAVVGIRPSPHDDYAPQSTPRDDPPTRRPPHATQHICLQLKDLSVSVLCVCVYYCST
jgi:hypothetical protein